MVPKTIDSGAVGPISEAIIVDLVLIKIDFRHSAQRHGAQAIQAMVDSIAPPKPTERSTWRVVLKPRACPAVLAVASDPYRSLGNHQSGDRHGFADGPGYQSVG